jgi:hypothetical protein
LTIVQRMTYAEFGGVLADDASDRLVLTPFGSLDFDPMRGQATLL